MTLEPRNSIPARRLRPWQVLLGHWFDDVRVELAIGALVLVSVALTLLEFTFARDGLAPSQQGMLTALETTNEVITWVFVVELTLRFLATSAKRRFFRTYWLDIIAVLPLLRIFRAARAIRLLRLVRLLRMFGVVSRLASHFPYILRRGAMEYIFVCGMLVVTVIFGSGAMVFFEGRAETAATAAEGASFSLEDSFWFSLYSLFAGEPIPGPPRTVGGKIVAVFVMFMGLTIFAMLTGTISAFMVERLQSEGIKVNWQELQNHVVICGWNSKAEIIVNEFRASNVGDKTPIVVITEWDHERPAVARGLESQVLFYNDDFTRVSALEHVGIHRADICIILADTTGGRSEQDADARTILAALTVEKLNPSVYTCAELLNREYGTHLKMGNVNDYVVSGEHGAYLLAQAAMNRGLMDLFAELLTYQKGNEFYRLKLPESWSGRTYLELFTWLKQNHNAVLVSVHRQNGEALINPTDCELRLNDDIVVIAEDEICFG